MNSNCQFSKKKYRHTEHHSVARKSECTRCAFTIAKKENNLFPVAVRKKKTRNKTTLIVHRNAKRDQRTPLDMPTTDPGSDLFFSTDEENYGEGDGTGTVPKSRRYLLHSDLQRRYIDTIGDSEGGSSQTVQRMPPELIVTPAKQGSSAINRTERTPDILKPAHLLSSGITEFPPVAGSLTKRTNSWHHLHNSGKCIPTLRIQNMGQLDDNTTEEQHITLRRKIWTGCSPEPHHYADRPRPLSWAMPPIAHHREKRKEIEEQEAFFAACSQKLVAWQQETATYSQRHKINLNFVNPEFPDDKAFTQTPKKIQKTSTKLDSDLKSQKRKNTLTKVSETSRIMSCLTMATSNITTSRKNRSSTSVTPNANFTLAPLTAASKTYVPSRFKTGGLVATAVQPVKKSKRRSLLNISKPAVVPPATAASSQVECEKSIVRKVKSKLKKKKSIASIKAKS